MAGSTRTKKPPVKTGAHRDIERQIGNGGGASKEHPDLDPLPPGWKSQAQQGAEDDAAEEERLRALRTQYRSQERARVREQNSPPPQPARRSAPARSPRSSPSSGRARRTSQPTLTNPSGGRLPIGFDGEGIAGAFFGAILYALILSVADYGAQGPLYWFKAKFMNQPAPAKTK